MLANAEVTDFDIAILIEKNVVKLYVSMYDWFWVAVRDALNYLYE